MPKIANIYIDGQIGNSYNADGSLSVKGVELQDVVAQVIKIDDADQYNVYIKSLGGSISVGQAIAKYIKSLKNCFTIADTECASMGTEIHLAVPKENRKIIAGTKYSIHNPLMDGISGNASELIEAAAIIKEYEKDMLKMYVNATGLSKDAVAGLMNQETSLTPEECIAMGFASEILPAKEFKAVAFFDKPIKTNDIMSKVSDLIDAAFAKFKSDIKTKAVNTKYKTKKGNLVVAQFGKAPAVGEIATTEGGEKAAEGSYEIENATIEVGKDGIIAAVEVAAAGVDYTTEQGVLHLEVAEVGSVATLDGNPAPAGDYTTEDGTIITIDDKGLVSGIETAAAEDSEIASLKAENAAMKKQIETMTAEFSTELEKKMTELKAEIGSSYVPKSAAASFNRSPRKNETSTIEEAKERKKSYRTIQA